MPVTISGFGGPFRVAVRMLSHRQTKAVKVTKLDSTRVIDLFPRTNVQLHHTTDGHPGNAGKLEFKSRRLTQINGGDCLAETQHSNRTDSDSWTVDSSGIELSAQTEAWLQAEMDDYERSTALGVFYEVIGLIFTPNIEWMIL